MNLFIFISTAIFMFFFVIWKTSDLLNSFMKITFFVMSAYGLLMSAMALGFVVKM